MPVASRMGVVMKRAISWLWLVRVARTFRVTGGVHFPLQRRQSRNSFLKCVLVVLLGIEIGTPLRLVWADADVVPEDQCIVDLELPVGATVRVDGRDYGASRHLTFQPLERQKTYPTPFKIQFQDGSEDTRTVLVHGGWRVRLVLAEANKATPELVPQTGHSRKVFSVAFSPDGSRALTGSEDTTAILWDVASGRQIRTFQGHKGSVNSVAFSPNGSQMLTGSRDEAAILWDVASGRQIRTFQGHKGTIYSVAFSPDGSRMLTGSSDERAILWDVADGRRLRTFQGHEGSVNSVAFSPDGFRMLTGSSDKRAILWDVADGRRLRTFQGHTDTVISVAFGPDGSQVLTGSWDKTAILWDASDGRQLRTFQGHKSSVDSVAFSPDGKKALIGYWSKAILWDVASGQQIRTFLGHKGTICSVAFSPDGSQVLTGSHDKTVMLYEAAYGRQLHVFRGFTSPLYSLYVSSDGSRVMVVSNGETVLAWDVAGGQQSCTVDGSQQSRTVEAMWTRSMAVSPDRSQVAIGILGVVWIRDVASGRHLRTFQGHRGFVNCAVFSPDGSHVLSGSEDKTAILWNAASGQQLRTFRGHHDTVTSVAVGPNASQVLTGSLDKTAILWNATNGQQLHTFRGHNGTVAAVAFSPDGSLALTGSNDKTAVLWDAASGQRFHTFQGHADTIHSVAFSPNGRALFTASGDGTIRLWDVATGQEMARLVSLDAGKNWLVVSPEGFFDGSEGGRQKVAFRIGGGLNVVPVDRFFNSFYRPGLLREVMQGQRALPEVRLGQKLPPILKIVSPKPGETESQEMTVEVEATDQGGGVAGLSLYDNDARIAPTGQMSLEGNTARRSFRLSLITGENRVKAKATSGDGAWESEPVEIVLRYEKPLAKSQLYLLSVGINRYADAGLNLRFAAPDAKAIADIFTQRGKTLYQEVHAKVLLDQDATKPGIKAALMELAAQSQPQDTLIVFLAGHGTTLGERYYFLPHELRRQAGSLAEDVRTQGLAGDVLSDWIGAAKAIRRIQIYDTCASGAALGLNVGRSGVALRGAVERLARAQGIFTIAAASATEEAKESDELGHGLLSYALLAGLKGVDRGPLRDQWVRPNGSDQVVDVMEWFTYASNQVPRLMEKYHGAAQDVPMHMQGKSFPVLPLPD